MRTFVTLFTLAGLGAPALADGPRQHRGFYLNMALGAGAASMRSDEADASVRGGAGSLWVAVGGALTENLILYGELFGQGMDDPDVDGTPIDSAAVSASLAGIGPGVTYYFMPLNLYVSGTIALVGGSVQIEDELEDDGRSERRTQAGLGLGLAVGKEWWLSGNWGLGVAGRVFGASMEDDDIVGGDSTWRAGGFALLLSATYN
jgi:hypothetical protein